MDVAGYLLSPKGDNSVKITAISQLDIDQDVTKPLEKILIGEMARAPSDIAEFVDDNGYAPFFIRWGEGPACLERDGEPGTDLRQGKNVFKISGEGKGTMKAGQQKCWLQWSEKMYERGIDIQLEPEGVAELARVDGMDRTVEFVWSEKVKKGCTLTLTRSNEGEGADDVYVGGEFLDKTVGMEKGKAKKKAPVAAAAAGGAKSNGGKSNGNKGNDSESEGDENNSKQEPQQKSGNRERGGSGAVAAIGGAAAGAAGAVAYGAKKAAAPITPASASRGVQDGGAEGGETAVKSKIPADACLIITQDLYFTKSQCVFIGGIIFAAYAWGKLA